MLNLATKKIVCCICLLLIAQDAFGDGVVVDRILAVVNEEIIALSSVRKYLKIKQFVEGKEAKAEINIKVIEEYIKRRLILQEDNKIRLSSVDETEVERELNKVINRSFSRYLSGVEMDLASVRAYLTEELIIRSHVERRLGFLVQIDEEEISAWLQDRNIHTTPDADPFEMREQARKELFQKALEKQKELWLEELIDKAEIVVN